MLEVPASISDGTNPQWPNFVFSGTVCVNGLNTVIDAYIAGLDPMDPQSCFMVEMAGSNILEWSGVSGRVYAVYYSTILPHGFYILESGIPWDAGIYTDTVHHEEAACFYRLGVQPQD